MISRRRSSSDRSPPIGIRMQAFHELLVAGLDLRIAGRVGKTQCVERLCLERLHLGSSRTCRAVTRGSAPPRLCPRARRLPGVHVRPGLGAGGLGVDPHLPCWPVTCERIALIGAGLVVIHAREVVVRLVVLAHVFKAEVVVVAFRPASLRRPVRPRRDASLPVADALVRRARTSSSVRGLMRIRSKISEVTGPCPLSVVSIRPATAAGGCSAALPAGEGKGPAASRGPAGRGSCIDRRGSPASARS